MNGPARFVFVALGLAVVAAALGTNGDVLIFLEIPGLAFVTALITLGLFAGFGPGVVGSAFADIFRRDSTPRERQIHTRVWHRAHGLAWGSGVLATLCSLILLVSNLEAPEKFLPSFWICLMPLFWSAIYAELLFAPFEAWSDRELAVPQRGGPTID